MISAIVISSFMVVSQSSSTPPVLVDDVSFSTGTLFLPSEADRNNDFTITKVSDTTFKLVKLSGKGRITYFGGFKSDGEALRFVMESVKEIYKRKER